MAASLTDKFMRVGQEGTLTSLQSPGKALAASSITIGSGANWESTTGFIIAIRTVDSTGVEVANTYTEWIATYSGSGTTVTINPVPVTGTDQVYTAGTNTQVFLPVSAKRENLLIDGMLAQHTQAGAHTGITTDTVTASGNITAASFTVSGANTNGGWTVGLAAPTSVTALGNRSYSMLWNGNDYSTTLSAGMRGRTTRTVATPTQSTSLNGTTQYYSKTSPAGMTFTNNFVVSAWIKLSSYPGTRGAIASRFNNTSGWWFVVLSDGRLELTGFSGASANFSRVQSYQSVPLNKWVHVSAQLDMLTFTATTTTSYTMIDGVDVPASVSRGGTNPTSLLQPVFDLQIGADNSTDFFPGKIAQVAIYSAKVTQATILASMHQTLAGTETSLISAYSFNNTINDLNTTNANNLTANGSAVATNADSPFGAQADGTISSTLDYHIYQKVSVSGGNTTAIVQVPEGCTIPTSGGVSAVAYSQVKAPYGMPVQRGKWSLESRVIAQATQNTPGTSTIYNLGNFQINLPVGEWSLRLDANYQISTGGTTNPGSLLVGISTANNTFSDPVAVRALQGRNDFPDWPVSIPGYASLSASAPYYINAKNLQGTCTFIAISTDNSASQLIAENAYL